MTAGPSPEPLTAGRIRAVWCRYANRVGALLESVPNLSEGRRPEVIERLAAAAAGAGGARLLDLHVDPDHDRSVLTLAGEAPELIAALLALYEAALAAIDLTRHRGAHPRVGAVDVVPFVPLAGSTVGGATMADAVAAARTLGAAVGARFGVPVYLYEEAASRPGRQRLPDLRRGGFEGFPAKIAQPGWEPDFGPPRVHPTAGVSIVGARGFLIAFNALLDTADPAVARAVARAVRESGGGLPAVRAIGVHLPSRGRVQVSMNLLDHRRTSMAAALAAVEAEAARHAARVTETEIVGLVPAAAVCGELGAGRVLEERLAAAAAAGPRSRP